MSHYLQTSKTSLSLTRRSAQGFKSDEWKKNRMYVGLNGEKINLSLSQTGRGNILFNLRF
jgi:hypothetical protein